MTAGDETRQHFPVMPSTMLGNAGLDQDEQPGRMLPGILHALRRRWLLVAFLGTLLGAGAAIGVYYTAQDSFTVRALIRIPIEREAIAFNPVGMDTAGFDVFVNTQRRLITSQEVLNGALDEVGDLPAVNEQPDPLAWLESLISTSFSSDSELMEIRLTYQNPDTAQKLLDAVVAAYLKSAGKREDDLRQERLTALRTSESEAKAELKDTLDDLDQTVRLENPDPDSDVQLNRQLLLQTRLDLVEVESELQFLQKAMADNASTEENQTSETSPELPFEITDEELDVFVAEDKESQALEQDIEIAEYKIDRAPKIFTPGSAGHEEYVAKREAEIEAAQAALVERREELRAELNRQAALMGDASGEPSTPESLPEQISKLTRDQSALQERIRYLQGLLPAAEYAHSAARRQIEVEVDVQTAQLESLMDQIRQMEVELKSPLRITQQGTTVVPKVPDRRPRQIKAALAGAAVFLLLGSIIVLLDMRLRRVSSPDDFVNDLRLNMIGTLPLLKRSKRNNQRISQALAEAVDSIAAALLCGRTALRTKAVMITSAVAGEGKTTLAANLATSLAGAGRRVLLVDFDLRRPMLHSVYDLERGPGVCEALIGEIDALSACRETDDPSLWVMPAGNWRQRAISQLAEQRLEQLFTELRAKFDFIVVDASPVLPIVDARLIGKHVDGTILSLLRDVSQVPKVASACRALESFDVRILGGVMIGSTGEVYYGYPPAQGQLPESA